MLEMGEDADLSQGGVKEKPPKWRDKSEKRGWLREVKA